MLEGKNFNPQKKGQRLVGKKINYGIILVNVGRRGR